MKRSIKSVGVASAAVAILGLVGMPGVAFADSGWSDCWHQSRTDMRHEFNRDHRFDNRFSDRDFRNFRMTTTNNNDVRVTNTNEQTAISGDATVVSRFGGEARTGDATNINDTSTDVQIRN